MKSWCFGFVGFLCIQSLDCPKLDISCQLESLNVNLSFHSGAEPDENMQACYEEQVCKSTIQWQIAGLLNRSDCSPRFPSIPNCLLAAALIRSPPKLHNIFLQGPSSCFFLDNASLTGGSKAFTKGSWILLDEFSFVLSMSWNWKCATNSQWIGQKYSANRSTAACYGVA